MAEFTFIDALRRILPGAPRLTIPPGDDTAELLLGGAPVLLAADMLLEGTHFTLADAGAELVGRKALAVNLSDVAAMAGTPAAALVSLALPRAGGLELARGVMAGIAALAAEYGVLVVGGDTNCWDGPLAVNVAIAGEAHPRGSVRRSGARPGDGVWVTGALGGSIRGRHLRFPPRVAEAAALHSRYGITAMIDLSDGLGGDLRHILAESGVGAVIDKAAIPVHPDAGGWEQAVSDGEDFELCFTLPAGVEPQLAGLALTRIGVITSDPDKNLLFTDGSVPPGGYAHRLG